MKVFVITLLPFEPKRFGGGYQAMYPLVQTVGVENVTSLYHWDAPQKESTISVKYKKLCKTQKLSGWFLAQFSLARQILMEKPDLLVCSPDRARVAFSVIVGRLLGVRVCLWQMDDTVTVPDSTGMVAKVKRAVRYVVGGLAYRLAHFRIAASKPLADIFEKRYSRKADRIIAKPLQEAFLPPCRLQLPIRIVYAGSASFEFYLEPVIELARVIEQKFAGKIEIYLYGPNEFPERVTKFACVFAKGQMSEDNTVRPLTEYDYALLTYSFGDKTVNFFKSSFPSKLIGYVGAGLPVISILDPEILVQHDLLKRDIGPIVNKPELIASLPDRILSISRDEWTKWSLNSNRWAVEDFQVNFSDLVKEVVDIKL